MAKIVTKLIGVVVLICFTSSLSYGQSKGQVEFALSPRKQLATIIFTGLGGAVLGLSTLSFYGRPQDHLDNIGTGFALGVIIGTGYVTYKTVSQATLEPRYKLDGEPDMYAFDQLKSPTQLSWTFNF